MRQVVLLGPRTVALRETPDLAPGPGQLRVAVEAAGICGSDLHGYRGDNDRRSPGVVMGHEVSGTVDAVGPGVDPGWLGRGVAVNPLQSCRACPECTAGRDNLCAEKALIGCTPGLPGGFADQLLVPVRSAVPWPSHVPLRHGALAEPFAVGLHAADLARPAGRTVDVIGGGPVGLSVALAARRLGATRVVVAARGGRRRRLFAGLGLEVAVPSLDSLPAADVTVDCVAASATIAEALRSTVPGGSVVVVGLAAAHTSLPMVPLVQGERVVRGSAQYPAATFARAVEWLAEAPLDLDGLVSRPYGLPEAGDAFRRSAAGRSTAMRTVIAPRAGISP